MKCTIPGVVLICGSQGSGKSNLLKYIIKSNRDTLKYGIAFSHTAFRDGNLEYIPKKYIHNQYNPEIMRNLMSIQSKLDDDNRHPAFVILDDCVIDSWVNCKFFSQMITQVRHYNLFVVITTQYVNKIPAFIRENAMQICMFSADIKRSIDALYESFGQKFETVDKFKKYLLENTKDYNFILYNRKDMTYSKMKAPIVKKMRTLKY